MPDNLILDLSLPVAILLVFYLYLLVKGELVKRPLFYCVGALGVLAALAAGFFMVGSLGADANKKGEVGLTAVKILANIIQLIGVLVAFVGAFAACFTGKLPVHVPGMEPKEEAGE